jgi:hypothetical protein
MDHGMSRIGHPKFIPNHFHDFFIFNKVGTRPGQSHVIGWLSSKSENDIILLTSFGLLPV